MKKKTKSKNDVPDMMIQIQEQLATMNQKLDSFMTKSLTELAQALATSKPVARPAPAQTHVRPSPSNYPPRRQMYTAVCFECGLDTELPFKPNGNRPVYCKECFAKRKGWSKPASVEKPVSPSIQPAASTTSTVKSKKKTATKKTAKKTTKKKKAPAKKKAATKKKAAPKKKATKKKAASKRKVKKKKK